MLRIAGWCWMAIAILHAGVGLIVYWPQWQMIGQAGWFNVLAPDPLAPIFEREDAFWFMMMTPFLVILGRLCLWAHWQKLTLPLSVSIILLGVVVCGIVLMPISGFWLVLIPSLMLLWASKATGYNASAE
ncbi:DUF6463 family protein [Vacuolonema iberomarrocanum]|uniref:DUF6463 family protein n=1 Tax=Vacuolonema iberomarrocanum TaxID=3454632 RepID=UPI0019D890E5|nr:hypothetical protein [filamentous cyanobacterium LEGE 07170]